MTDSGRYSPNHSQPDRTIIEFDSFWAQSGLYLLWNRLFPGLSVAVIPPPLFTCECHVSKALDGIQVTVTHMMFSHNATVLELEFTVLDRTEGTVRLHPWNTTIDLRKCVNKNLRVGQITKAPSVDLHPGEPRRISTTYRAVKLSPRLRWIDVFVSISRGKGQFVEGNLRIPYETLVTSLRPETVSELSNIIPELVDGGLLFLYLCSPIVALVANIVLRGLGVVWYCRLPILVALAVSCAVFLRWQFIRALAGVGYRDIPSVSFLHGRLLSAFDPARRAKERRK